MSDEMVGVAVALLGAAFFGSAPFSHVSASNT